MAPEEIFIPVDDGTALHTWLYRPCDAATPVPVISMAHGCAGPKYYGLDGYAPQDMAEAAFETAGEPKKSVRCDGGHFDAYSQNPDGTSGAALDWFRGYL